MIETRHLRSFVAVAEELHFGRAAQRLHMAQSPLSQQIRRLERELGTDLLTRGHHVVGLTDAGRAFLTGARRTLAALEAAEHDAHRAARGEVGTIVVGYVNEVTADLLPLSLKRFKDTFPDIGVELREGTTGQLLEALRHEEVDVTFARSPGSVGPLEYEQLVTESLMAALPDPHAAGGEVTPVNALADEAFVLPSRVAAEGLRRDIEEACADAGFRPRASREAGSLSAVLLLVAAGAGVALVPASVAHLYPVPGVHYCHLAEPTPVTTAGMAWRPDGTSGVVGQFMEITREVARSHEGDEDVWPERHIVSR